VTLRDAVRVIKALKLEETLSLDVIELAESADRPIGESDDDEADV
jgi:hypothetical protein